MNKHYPLVLARNVKDFIVECWDTNALQWDDEWVDTNSIPPMVRVSLCSQAVPIPAARQPWPSRAFIVLPSITMAGPSCKCRAGGRRRQPYQSY